MANGKHKSATFIGFSVVGMALLAAGLFATGVFGGYASDIESRDPERFVDAMAGLDNDKFSDDSELRGKALAAAKEMSFSDLMDLMNSKDLSEEERRNLEKNMASLMQESIRQNVDEYYNAETEEEKLAALDRHLDEFEKYQKEMRDYYEAHKDDPDFQERMKERQSQWRSPTRQDRKERMEGQNPDEMVRMFKYFGQMRERANARGMGMGGGRR